MTTIISLLLALINIGSAVAFNALTSLVVAGFFSSYAISISLITIRRFYGEPIQWGPWNMGKFGLPVNLFAMVYIVIALFFSFWPQTLVVTPATMNWSSLVFGVVIIFSVGWFVVRGRKFFAGPIIEVTEADYN